MIQYCLKKYFKNFKYVLIPMGIIYLAFIIVVLSCAQQFIEILTTLTDELVGELSTTFSNIELTRTSILDVDYYKQLWNEVVGIIERGGEEAIGKIGSAMVGGGILVVVSILFAWWYTNYWMKHDTIKTKGLWVRKVIVWVVRAVFVALFTTLSVFLIGINGYFSIPIALVFFFILAFENIITTWFLYFKDRKLKEFLKVKYVISSLITYYLLAGLTILVIVGIGMLNLLLAVVLAIPLLIYGFAMIEIAELDFYNKKVRG